MTDALWRIAVDDEVLLAAGPADTGPAALLPVHDLDELVSAGADALTAALGRSSSPVPDGFAVLAPIAGQPVWASGVTYERSRAARNAESGTPDVYDRVYDAERPELFLKAVPGSVRGPGQTVGIRADSTWDVPEPEITVVLDAAGRIAGYCCGNDMSSRSIEGENPLYLPQAKAYDHSCALGPCLVPAGAVDVADLTVGLRIERAGEVVVEESIGSAAMHRAVDDLAAWLYRANTFPLGAYLMTGTGIVPEPPFTLAAGDLVTVTISGLGTLANPVAVVGGDA